MIATKTGVTPAHYVTVEEQEFVGPGTVIELFQEAKIEQQPYYKTRATSYSDGTPNTIKGWISKAQVQQLLITGDLEKIKLTDECPASCVAKNNAG